MATDTCTRCGAAVSDGEQHMIGEGVFCANCFDKVCGACGREIPEPDQQYDIGPIIGPGTTCSLCTARHVQWLCNGCGAEIRTEPEQVKIHEDTKYGGYYCRSCADEAKQKAVEAAEAAGEADDAEEAPF